MSPAVESDYANERRTHARDATRSRRPADGSKSTRSQENTGVPDTFEETATERFWRERFGVYRQKVPWKRELLLNSKALPKCRSMIPSVCDLRLLGISCHTNLVVLTVILRIRERFGTFPFALSCHQFAAARQDCRQKTFARTASLQNPTHPQPIPFPVLQRTSCARH